MYLLTLHSLLGGPDAHSVKPRNLVYPIVYVEGLHPLVYLGHLINPIDIEGGSGPIVWEPHKFGCREQVGDRKIIAFTWVTVVLVIPILGGN